MSQQCFCLIKAFMTSDFSRELGNEIFSILMEFPNPLSLLSVTVACVI